MKCVNVKQTAGFSCFSAAEWNHCFLWPFALLFTLYHSSPTVLLLPPSLASPHPVLWQNCQACIWRSSSRRWKAVRFRTCSLEGPAEFLLELVFVFVFTSAVSGSSPHLLPTPSDLTVAEEASTCTKCPSADCSQSELLSDQQSNVPPLTRSSIHLSVWIDSSGEPFPPSHSLVFNMAVAFSVSFLFYLL